MRLFMTIVGIAIVLSVFDGCDDSTSDSGSDGDTSGDFVNDYSTDYESGPADGGGDVSYSDADVADLGESICGAFDRGASASQAESVFIGAGILPTDADGLVYLAVNAYCPEYLALVD